MNRKLHKYEFTTFWQMAARVEVEAETLDEAISMVEADDYPLPTNGDYVVGSFEVDREGIDPEEFEG